MGRLTFRAFKCEMKQDYITVSRLFLIPCRIKTDLDN